MLVFLAVYIAVALMLLFSGNAIAAWCGFGMLVFLAIIGILQLKK